MSQPEEPSKFAIHEAARDGRTQVVESLLAANPKLAQRVDDDGRLPLHWAVSYNHLDIAKLLAATKDFDADVQDGSGWTPLMIAVSLKDGEELVDLLLRKDADVNAKSKFHRPSTSLPTSPLTLPNSPLIPNIRRRQRSTSSPRRKTSTSRDGSLTTNHQPQHASKTSEGNMPSTALQPWAQSLSSSC
ncbi:ankyrin repeat-containing domain protein [Rhexocercosporidium sp. MPI-PUGE-AT-0058]|nr:ankyrin repeat-containing domain protein [Rhexocercosporidium sp. MPI-PUGE-AT-0058]